MNETTIVIEGDDIRVWTMMMALKELKVFDIRFGSFTVHLDGEKRISNVVITTNHRVVELG